jgi:hypothetical protein
MSEPVIMSPMHKHDVFVKKGVTENTYLIVNENAEPDYKVTADGKVEEIKNVEEKENFGGRARRIRKTKKSRGGKARRFKSRRH